MSTSTEPIVRIRLTPAQVRETLDLVDRTAEVVDAADKRRHARWRFRLPGPMRMACVRDGGHTIYELAPRDLSVQGLAGLVGGFLHTGTVCMLSVPMLDGERFRLSGTVRVCKHVAGAIHEVGIELADPVDVSCFVEQVKEEVAPTQALLAELQRCADRLGMLAREGAPWADLRKSVREIQQLTGGGA